MPSLTRRRALAAAAGLTTTTAGCIGDATGDGFPLSTDWQASLREPSSVGVTGTGQLVAGSRSPFADRPLIAGLDTRTGERTWSVTTGKGVKSPLAVGDGRAYAFSKAEQAVAADATTGDVVWRRSLTQVDEADPGVVEFAPIVLEDRVVLPISGTEDDVPDRLVALDRDGGSPAFTHELPASLAGAPGRTAASVVAPLVDGRLVSLSRTGTVTWTFDVGASLSSVGTAGGRACVGAATEELLALDADAGTVAWRGDLANTVFARPLVTGDRVVVGGADYSLRAFDPDSGAELWRDDLANAVTHGPMPVGDRLVTLVGGGHRIRGPSGSVPFQPTTLYVHERDGTRVRAVRLDGVSLEGGGVEWADAAGDTVYLGQTFGLTRLAPEAITDA